MFQQQDILCICEHSIHDPLRHSPVVVHKTLDHAPYHKSADIRQMLIVYKDEYAMEEAENEQGYKIKGSPSYYHS